MSFLDNVITAIFNPPRAIGSIAIQCTLEENHYDELVITDHPVQQGAMIADHAYKRPAEVTIRAGWSNSGLQSVINDLSEAAQLLTAGALNFTDTTAPFNYADQVYQELLSLQASRAPFQIITGKRTYNNMLIRALAVTTDEKSENALFVTAVCRQVILVSTQVVQFPDASVMNAPQNNAGVVNAGVKSLAPAPAFNNAAAGLIPGFPAL